MGWAAGIVMLALFVMFLQDIFQKEHAVRRNFPVIGRLRYFMESIGVALRQYLIANDREELPFNRMTRSWVYRTAKGMGGMIGFGSTNDMREPGTVIFINSPYPQLEEDCESSPPLAIGGYSGDQAFEARRVVNISGMSYGALSSVAIKALTRGAAASGSWLNTGEGGLSPYHLEQDCDRIFQIGTAKYGVRDDAGKLSDQRLKDVAQHVKAFEIKLAQGAKPGKGGILPAVKVTEEIARIRGIPVHVSSRSPNRHVDIASPDDLLDMVQRVRDVTGRPVGFKTVIADGTYPEMLSEAILRRGIDSAPDFITVDGGDGGTGAAPQALADHVGLPLSEALPIAVDVLVAAGLKDRIRVIASGRLVTSARAAWALCVGADFVNTARGFMFSLGCIQSLQCNKDTCPTGITTHNRRLQKGLAPEEKGRRVATYSLGINHELDLLAHSCGLTHAREFTRKHVRIVQNAGLSIPLDQLYPYPSPMS
ncbi:MAG: glutamate synthase [Acidithiobacillales bacterium SG8_45]|nr:MAG: glutamate synthase [Acidithiobacillales bacterium SG8_45]